MYEAQIKEVKEIILKNNGCHGYLVIFKKNRQFSKFGRVLKFLIFCNQKSFSESYLSNYIN